MYCNAGVLLVDGLDWVNGPLTLLRDPLLFFSDVSGTLKQSRGLRLPLKPSAPPTSESASASLIFTDDDDKANGLGTVFTANVLGHYALIRGLEPALRRSRQPHGARIVFTGSHTADARHFSWADPQALYRCVGQPMFSVLLILV